MDPLHQRRLGVASLTGLICLIASLAAPPSRGEPPEKKAFTLRFVEEGTDRPLEGVSISYRAGNRSAKAQTDAHGACTLDVPEPALNYFSVSAKMDGFVPVTIEWREQGEKPASIPGEHSVALEKGTTIGGLI